MHVADCSQRQFSRGLGQRGCGAYGRIGGEGP